LLSREIRLYAEEVFYPIAILFDFIRSVFIHKTEFITVFATVRKIMYNNFKSHFAVPGRPGAKIKK